MEVYLYYNTKRLNSTALPPTETDVLECYFKEDSSLLNPVLKISAPDLPTINYFWLKGRYYWITDIIALADGLFEIHGAVDVLTTYRGHIFNTNAFVLYDSTPNTQLPDNRLGIETDCDTYTSTANMPWHYDDGDGTYLIAITGDPNFVDFDVGTRTPNARAGTGVYKIDFSDIDELGFDIYDFFLGLDGMRDDFHHDLANWLGPNGYLSPTGTTPADVMTAIIKAAYGMGNAMIDTMVEYPTRLALLIAQNLLGGGTALQNVKAAYWLPFVIPDGALSDAGNVIALGTYTDTLTHHVYRVTDPVLTAVDIPVTIPWHFNDWRDVSCTEIMLYIPLIGCINIPPECVKGNDTLYIRLALNAYSGELAASVRCDGGELGTYGASSAMNILIGDSNINMGGAVNTIAAAVTKQYAAAAGAAAETLAGMSTSVGGIGGGAGTGLSTSITCICRCHETSQNPSALLSTIGTPTRQLKRLYSGQGFVQCLNAQVSGASVTGEPYASQTELQQINEYLNTGVYLE